MKSIVRFRVSTSNAGSTSPHDVEYEPIGEDADISSVC